MEASNISDLEVGQVVEGTVKNILDFGIFVDIGVKKDGLVHVSQIADKYISNPADEVEVGQKIKVKITGIDLEAGKIQLSMKEVSSEENA
ncbi:hypothetical protein CSA08_03470 [Candidatus Gracilibacteria bacterium]|nr:MAG: hypothetical protein CSA08_03470 [Candidatus Gracilibacteria bacterium]